MGQQEIRKFNTYMFVWKSRTNRSWLCRNSDDMPLKDLKTNKEYFEATKVRLVSDALEY